jgi:3-hydroxyacyl-CoA dehydrogenase/enoyl-CoA hydratase/3-hydroxybutyryl-CoA epimerase
MNLALDKLASEADDTSGVVLASGKETFVAGADLNDLISVDATSIGDFRGFVDGLKSQLRRLETAGKPVVAAISGSAVGGGLELALACHHRVVVDAPTLRMGLPEVTLGLLPGMGGTTRLVRLLGIERALTEFLLSGTLYGARAAVERGLADELAGSAAEAISLAKQWIRANPAALQPWDRADYAMPGGTPNPNGREASFVSLAPALRARTHGAPAHAAENIVCAAYEGAQVGFDDAGRIETRYLLDLVLSPVTKNMIGGYFFDTQLVRGGARDRTAPRRNLKAAAVVGGGMMGAGIAYSCARAGMSVAIKDVSLATAQNAKQRIEKLVERQVARSGLTPAGGRALLDRITPVAGYADLADAEIVIEAVHEDPELKKEVYAGVEAVVGDDALIASNTSTLPITELAAALRRPERFSGLHFFSPVDRMDLVEVIAGGSTSGAGLSAALDFVRQIRKMPISVKDSRGFFTSRVILARITEAAAMIGEGVAPSSIEQASLQSGYPTSVLALLDELNMSLLLQIRQQTRLAVERAGGSWRENPGDEVLHRMVLAERPGRLADAGFYDYDGGSRSRLWPEIATHFPAGSQPPPLRDIKDRLIFSEVVESLRAVAEGVITSYADANVGSLYGIGFPGWTGGILRFAASYPEGVAAFTARAGELADQYGERFRPPADPEHTLAGLADRG